MPEIKIMITNEHATKLKKVLPHACNYGATSKEKLAAILDKYFKEILWLK